MNIVILNDNAQVNGGGAKVAILEACGLADKGHQVFFMAAIPPTDPRLEQHPNIQVISTGQSDLLSNSSKVSALVQGWWNRIARDTLRKLLSGLNPLESIIHLHVWSRALSPSVIQAAAESGFTTVCTLHDYLLACPNGAFFLHPQNKICQHAPMGVACLSTNCDTRSYSQKLWRVGRQFIQNQVVRAPSRLHGYIAHSSLVEEKMSPFLHNAPIFELASYVESERQEPAPVGDHESFCFLGRLVREKGVEMLARSACQDGLPLRFVGSGPLEAQIREIHPSSEITGWVDHQTSLTYLRRSRALVFPSLWYETFGLVVLEAAAHGVPSVVSDISAARELVVDGVTGLYFRSGDEEDLRSKLRMLRDPKLAVSLGRAAFERFWSSSYCSLDTHITSLLAIYDKVLLRCRRGSTHALSPTFVGGINDTA